MKPAIGWLFLVLGLFQVPLASADAMVRSQAMFANTIAQYYVDAQGVRVELEIGLDDLDAFRNLLPDDIYQRLGHAARPLGERLPEFFNQDLVIATDSGPLPGYLQEIAPGNRILRDEVTGEVLPVTEEEAEMVVFVRLLYPFAEDPPARLILSPPTRFKMANVGFVLYHNTVAVNDFRYLSRGMAVDLDWEDPWYTAFAVRNMRRSYFSPMSGFLYVEPFEVRKEVIVRPKDMQRWLDLGLEGVETIAADQRGLVLEKIAAFLTDKQPVEIDGVAVPPILDRANFLNRTLASSLVVEPGVDINLDSATVGVIFVYPTNSLPQKATMTWDMFDERIQLVPSSAVDEAGPLPTFLEPDYRVLEWENFLRNPTIPGLVALAPPPGAAALWLYKLRWWALGLTVILLSVWARRQQLPLALGATASLLVLGLSFVLGRPLAPPDEATETVVIDLLRNIYQAFDYREESDIYDTLDRSVSGALLTDIYLQTRRGLELVNQGGARAKVKSVELEAIEISEADEPNAFRADVTWNVNGSVGHWGHVHARSNQYQAQLLIQALDQRWKLIKMNVVQETRL
jgi:hypothetical protein